MMKITSQMIDHMVCFQQSKDKEHQKEMSVYDSVTLDLIFISSFISLSE